MSKTTIVKVVGKLAGKMTSGAAGYDIECSEDTVIEPRKVAKVPTGIKLALPPGWKAQVLPRSGLSTGGIFAVVGTIDSDYRGEICVLMYHIHTVPVIVRAGQRVAQLCFTEVPDVTLKRVTRLSSTKRGAGGFGSTGA